jgi:plasmid maintenance system antidote protein VapI
MKIKGERLSRFLRRNGMTESGLARRMGVSPHELKRMLKGEPIDKETTECLVAYFGAETAQELIDWEAIGKANPHADKGDGGTI